MLKQSLTCICTPIQADIWDVRQSRSRQSTEKTFELLSTQDVYVALFKIFELFSCQHHVKLGMIYRIWFKWHQYAHRQPADSFSFKWNCALAFKQHSADSNIIFDCIREIMHTTIRRWLESTRILIKCSDLALYANEKHQQTTRWSWWKAISFISIHRIWYILDYLVVYDCQNARSNGAQCLKIYCSWQLNPLQNYDTN